VSLPALARTGEPRAGFLARWERYWFGEASLVRLAVFRIVLLVAAFDGVWLPRHAIFQFAAADRPPFLERTWRPILAFQLLGLGPPDPRLVQTLWVVLLIAIALGILGLFTRVSCALVALLGFYWIGSEYSVGKPHHTCVPLIFGLFALPFAPVGARLSLDALLRRLRAARRGADPRLVPEQGAWAAFPLRLVQLTAALGYFFAGSTKLAISGLDWANGYTLQGVMVEYRSDWSGPLSDQHALLVLMSAGLLFGQVGFPLALVSRAARWVFVPLMIVFHLMAMKTMATGPFLTLWLTLAAFVELERVPAFLARTTGRGPLARRAALVLLYAVLAAGTLALYLDNKPAWLALLLVPAALAGVLWCFPRLLPPLEIVVDPARAGRFRAWGSACDWGARLRWREEAGSALRVRRADGRELRGAARALALLVRLPPALVAAPFVVRALGAAAEET